MTRCPTSSRAPASRRPAGSNLTYRTRLDHKTLATRMADALATRRRAQVLGHRRLFLQHLQSLHAVRPAAAAAGRQRLLHAAQRDHGRRLVELGASIGSAAGCGAIMRLNQMVSRRGPTRPTKTSASSWICASLRRYTSIQRRQRRDDCADPDDLQDGRTVRLQSALTDQEIEVMAHATIRMRSLPRLLALALLAVAATGRRTRRVGARRAARGDGQGDADRGRGERRRDQQCRCRQPHAGCSRCPPALPMTPDVLDRLKHADHPPADRREAAHAGGAAAARS